METRKMQLALSAGALALSLALAGCGGGGSSGPAKKMMPDPPMPVSLTAVTTDGVDYVPPTTTPDGDPLMIKAGMETDSGSVTFACEAGGADCEVMVADDGSVTSTGGMVTAMNSAAFQTALNKAKEEAEEAEKARIAAATKAALTKADAIKAEAALTTNDGPGGEGARTDHTVAIARGNDGTTVTITVDGAQSADPKFEKAGDDLTSSTNPGQMLTRTMAADGAGNVVQEVAVVFTDIGAPTPTPFAEVNELDVSTDKTNDTPNETNEAFAVDENGQGVLALVESTMFSATTSAVRTYKMDDDDTADMDEADEVPGTYQGAMGTYRCDGSSNCTVTTDADGMITAMSDGWVFIPAEGAMADVSDAEFLHYGFWLKKTTDSDGAVTYNEVQTFAGASTDLGDSGSVSSVTGIATYSGGATGVYVMNKASTLGGGGTEVSEASSGHFTADANLRAYFEGGDTPANMADTLTGTIDNFMLSGMEMNDWSVTLQSDQDLIADGIQGSASGIHSGTASGNVMGQPGSFSATFHGDLTAVEGVVPKPSAVTGEFNSVFSNGSVAGAFGANLDK